MRKLEIKRFSVLSITPRIGYEGGAEYVKVGYIEEARDGTLRLGIERAVPEESSLYVSGVLFVHGRILEERTDGYGLHVTAEVATGPVNRTIWQRGASGRWGEASIPCDLAPAQLPEGMKFYAQPPAEFGI